MGISYSTHPPRRPRHAAGETGFQVQVSPGGSASTWVPAVLVNLSRHGACVRLGAPLPEGEPLLMRIHESPGGRTVDLQVALRWQRHDPRSGDGAWLVGCAFTTVLAWETLGELFLSGALRGAESTAAGEASQP